MRRLGKRGSREIQDGGTHEGGIKTVTQWGKRKGGETKGLDIEAKEKWRYLGGELKLSRLRYCEP
jgi:hypothetical protein